MNYAFWIAILVVFIAVAPAIFRNRRKGDGKSSGDAGDGETGDGDGGGDGGGD